MKKSDLERILSRIKKMISDKKKEIDEMQNMYSELVDIQKSIKLASKRTTVSERNLRDALISSMLPPGTQQR